MLKLSKLAALVMAGAIIASPAYAEDKDAATVNGIAIPQERVDLQVKAAAMQGQADTPELRKTIRENLINVEVLSQEAVKKGIDKKPEVVQELELARQNVLGRSFIQDYIQNHPISEDTLKKEYDSLKAHLGTKEYKVAHILVDTEAEAKAIEAQLKKKGKFDKIAKEKSKDAGSGAEGGELGWNVPSNFVKPFADAVMTLNKGQVSAPVQSQFGWHIIKLEDVRNLKVPTYEQLKPNLMRRLQQQDIQKLIADLRNNAKIQ
ncbi:MAG: peptidylprolyl isomerase [Sideroxydans sp.]|nr:peptidylprolyl isomerase [Sideroxydans sp.]